MFIFVWSIICLYLFVIPGNSRIEEENDKIEKYQDLGRELQKIWNVKVKIIPLVVGSLGAIPSLVID